VNKTKYKIISLSLLPEMHDELLLASKKAGLSLSKLIRELVNKHLDLLVHEGNEIPVILKIPAHLKSDEEGLKKWFAVKIHAIIKALTKSE